MTMNLIAILLTALLSSPTWPGVPSDPPERSSERRREFGAPVPVARWGELGHRMAAQAAAARLPSEMPEFFRRAADQLVYLNPEPDRWREGRRRAMNEAFRYDHFIDLENVPLEARSARDRWEFLEALFAAGVEAPHEAAGFLPFVILELQQRVTSGFARWRREPDPVVRRWIEERIVNDAGILGHFVTDASNPHHTTIHYNGWVDARVQNPGGYATDSGVHARFETNFVRAHVTGDAVLARVSLDASDITNVREAVWDLILDSNAHVPTLYEIDRDVGFEPEAPPGDEALRFAIERLAKGAEVLRDLWWAAWVQSGP